MLDQRLKQSVAETHQDLLQQGTLPSPEQLKGCYTLFQSRFGPDVLGALEGEKLLNFMHVRPNKDALVYWLEFKDDNEFPAHFGSISGGSALKFGLYFRRET